MKRKTKKSTKKPNTPKLTPQEEAKKQMRELAAKVSHEALGFHLSPDGMLRPDGGTTRPATPEEQALWKRLIGATEQLAGLFSVMMGKATLTVVIRGGFQTGPHGGMTS